MIRSPKFLRTLRFAAVFSLAFLTLNCGEEKGGDHIPDTNAYQVEDPSLPPASTTPDTTSSTGVSPTALSSVGSLEADYLRSFLHISEQYYICLDSSYFNAAQIEAADRYLDRKTGDASNWGLEPALNLTLASVDQFRSSRELFSSRLELHVVASSRGRCDLVITRASETTFPFDEADFEGIRVPLLQRGQVNVGSKKNRVPIVYLKSSESATANNPLIQSGVAAYLGMRYSDRSNSPLNPESADGTPKWTFLSGSGSIMIGSHESFAMFGFGLFYQDILKPADLDRLHHYQDQLRNDDAVSQDPTLEIPAASAPAEYAEAIGQPYIHGAITQTAVNVCFENQSSAAIPGDWVEKYFSFTNLSFQGGIIDLLVKRDNRYSLAVALTDTGCHLLVSVRDEASFPFAERNFNGLYAKAGSIKDAADNVTQIPVVYLNASNLELDPEQSETSAQKYIQLVLRHEFAHFLGFKHSPSDNSILSPSGYNENWDHPGDDTAMFDEFLRHWSTN